MPLDTAGRAGVKLYPADGSASSWCVYRRWPDDAIHVVAACGTAQQRLVPFAASASGELLLLSVAEGQGAIWLVVYDAGRNIPSGRVPGVVEEGVDVYRLEESSIAAPSPVALRLPLGGFDNIVYAAVASGGLTLCAVRRCFSVSDAGRVDEWNLALPGYEFVELVIAPGWADAIVRTLDDPVTGSARVAGFHYAWARLRPESASLEIIADHCLPYRLELATARANWRCAASAQDHAELLALEVRRMSHAGLMDFGASNFEGRIAWSQVYYLNGLMQLAGSALPALAAAADWSWLRARLRAEIGLLALRGSAAAGGFASRRYSINRTPILFALHLGRIARTLAIADAVGLGDATTAQARNTIQTQLSTLSSTVEGSSSTLVDGVTYASLSFSRGSDFWADGINVPFNYVSAYVDGVLAGTGLEPAGVARLNDLMTPLLQLEPVTSAEVWQYWWGRGRSGWTAADSISTNTPSYAGYTGVAHITYRSMDALALLRLRAAGSRVVPAGADANFRRLAGDGKLLPWLNEQFAAENARVVLAPAVAYRYARSAAPWELQSQVWALEQLARSSN